MTQTAPGEALVVARNLVKRFPVRTGLLGKREYKTAVNDVSFEVPSGKTVAIVGESGSGKTTVALMVLDLLSPTHGHILYDGERYAVRTGKERLALRRKIQVVFQDPYSSLNGRMNVREALTEGMVIHNIGNTAKEREEMAVELLKQVSLRADALDKYPHEFSGGQRQRIAIARALSVQPSFIVLDEPTSALDVSVQSQVLNLLQRLQREMGLTYLFISHNLEVVSYMSDYICVMENGMIIERGTVEEIFDTPKMEYTKRLLAAIPRVEV